MDFQITAGTRVRENSGQVGRDRAEGRKGQAVAQADDVVAGCGVPSQELLEGHAAVVVAYTQNGEASGQGLGPRTAPLHVGEARHQVRSGRRPMKLGRPLHRDEGRAVPAVQTHGIVGPEKAQEQVPWVAIRLRFEAAAKSVEARLSSDRPPFCEKSSVLLRQKPDSSAGGGELPERDTGHSGIVGRGAQRRIHRAGERRPGLSAVNGVPDAP